MACLQKLREDVGTLESLFPKHHERFQANFQKFLWGFFSLEMACLQKLREDVGTLESLFPKHHERFQANFQQFLSEFFFLEIYNYVKYPVLSASVDEVIVQFITPENKPIVVTGNILAGDDRDEGMESDEDFIEMEEETTSRKDAGDEELRFFSPHFKTIGG
ncbi:unnamed protein product [Gongylonema pulchrum]|uniref:TFIID_NTD2 domain-containing protein n=1 Tax=Gongylonema pulchrum TaxID=637853 RepID=A0A183DRS4_9BILA|nr:unnamed protein product [Gongylonema pulchrum]